MTPQSETVQASLPADIGVSPVECQLPFRPLKAGALCAWGVGAVASFHAAYEFWPPFIIVFLACMYQLAHVATRPHAMYSGWVLGLLIYGPQLAFFWNIFGFGAVALWLVLATWLSIYLVLQRFALLKLGPQLGALAAPFLWTGVEYFRSELYYLRFSWLNIGYAFSPFPQEALVSWLGMYGVGFALMLLAASFPFRRGVPRRQQVSWLLVFAVLVAGGFLASELNKKSTEAGSVLRVAGVQLEFAEEGTVVDALDKLLGKVPDAQLFVMSEYSFDGPVPSVVKSWCARNGKYLIAGGKDYVDASETEFRKKCSRRSKPFPSSSSRMDCQPPDRRSGNRPGAGSACVSATT